MAITQTRKSVFETNSSSSHSLTIEAGDLLFDASLFSDPTSAKEGYVEVALGEYGWEFETFTSLESKLSYLITDLAQRFTAFRPEDQIARVQDALEYKVLDNFLFEKTGVRIKLINSSGYVDHQSANFASALITNTEKLANFLFNKKSYFETGNDNDYDYYYED